MNLVPFESWADVMAYANTGQPLYYKAPLDHFPARLTSGGKSPFTYAVQKRTLRVWPPGSVGRGRNRTADPFTADAGHLERFLRPIENELPGRHGGLEHHRMAQQLFFRTRDQLEKQDAFTVSGMDAKITILTDAIRQMKPYANTNVSGAKEWLHSFEQWLEGARARREGLRREHGASGSVREGGRGRQVAAVSDDLKEIGYIGDVNWPEHGGGPVYERSDGTAVLFYVEPPTDDVEFNDPEARWTVYNIELEQGAPTWGDINAVARTTDQSPFAIKNGFKSDDPMQRAWAYETWAAYYGWAEFDQYARQLTCSEMNDQFDADLDCAPPEEEEEEDEEEDEEDDDDNEEVIDAKVILDGLGRYLEHESHDAPKVASRIARMIEGANNSKKIDKVLEDVDKLIGGHGVEPINGDYHVDNYYRDIVALYINMGDTYDTTLLYETDKDRFLITSWGDWVEHNERKYKIG